MLSRHVSATVVGSMNPAAAKSAIRAWAGDGTRGGGAAAEVERERETRVYELTVLLTRARVLRREPTGHSSHRSGRSGW